MGRLAALLTIFRSLFVLPVPPYASTVGLGSPAARHGRMPRRRDVCAGRTVLYFVYESFGHVIDHLAPSSSFQCLSLYHARPSRTTTEQRYILDVSCVRKRFWISHSLP